MSNGKRQGNRRDRRLAPANFMDDAKKEALLERISYTGSAMHKRRPGDYKFVPSHNPRAWKSPCDNIRPILSFEAIKLFRSGVQAGMVSYFQSESVPKYVWAVDQYDHVYEAKTRPERETTYHGYLLEENEGSFRQFLLKEWKRRCL